MIRFLNLFIRILILSLIMKYSLIFLDLLPAKVLIVRVKRLINFFMMPKQTERLLDIQKNIHHSNNEESIYLKSILRYK